MVIRPDDIPQRLLADLRGRLDAPELAYAEPPTRILSGAENWIFALRLRGAPAELAGPLILRRYRPSRDPAGLRAEASLQRALAAQGYPAPRVPFVCEDPAALGGAYLLMERLPGRVLVGTASSLLESFGSPARGARHLLRGVYEAAHRAPRELARLMLRLHALDPAPLIEALDEAGVGLRELTPAGRLADLERRAAAARLEGLAPPLAWLRERCAEPPCVEPAPPESESGRLVLCHGDLHFMNVLVEGPRVTGVVDWSRGHFAFADPAFDVGVTRALFSVRLPGVPPGLRPVVHAAQGRLRRGFCAHYARGRAVDPEGVRWGEVYRLVREMVGAGEALRRRESAALDFLREGGNPWTLPEMRRSALAHIRRRTGRLASLPEAP